MANLRYCLSVFCRWAYRRYNVGDGHAPMALIKLLWSSDGASFLLSMFTGEWFGAFDPPSQVPIIRIHQRKQWQQTECVFLRPPVIIVMCIIIILFTNDGQQNAAAQNRLIERSFRRVLSGLLNGLFSNQAHIHNNRLHLLSYIQSVLRQLKTEEIMPSEHRFGLPVGGHHFIRIWQRH